MVASQGVLMPPLGSGRAIPKDENQVSNGCRVRNTTAQNIHFVKPPPMTNAVEPSCRKATPASTRETNAADGASKRSNEMTSFSSCGVCIVSLSKLVFALRFWQAAVRPLEGVRTTCPLWFLVFV